MSHRTAAHPLPTVIALGPSPQRRLADALTAALARLRRAWAHVGEQRNVRRRAAAQRALIASLDAATLRDLGLGDWVVPRRDDGSRLWREFEQHRF